MRFDAVIIGAGPSGLAAAARLGHFGVRVCLLEAHRRLGGLNSWHHVKGREISTGLHALTNIPPGGKGGPLAKLLRQLRLKYSDLDLRLQVGSSIRFPSAALRFSNDREEIRAEVARVFPGQVDAFDSFRRRVRETDEGELTDRRTSAREVLRSYLSEPLLVDMLLCPVMFYGNPGGVSDGRDAGRELPDMDWLLFCVVWKCIFESGFGHPAGGMRPLWEKLAARIAGDGGEVRLSSRVERLESVGGAVRAARLCSGEEIEGDLFFSSAGGPETEVLLGLPDSGARMPVGEISIAEGVSVLDAPASAAGMDDTIIFYSFADRLRFARPDGIVEDSNGVVCAPGNYLPAAESGDDVLKITQLANYRAWSGLEPEAYALAKREAAAGMARALARLGIAPPRAREHPGRFAAFDDLFTPVTLARYTSHLGGALYGSPVKSRTGATVRSNLFLIGTDQGFHGIVGAMLSGVAMANLHCLSKRSG